MPATIPITCPKCKKLSNGPAELRGKKIKCKDCAHVFIVDVVDPNRASADLVPLADDEQKAAGLASVQKHYQEDEDDGIKDYGVTHLDLTPRCPHCAQEMESADATICLYCGYNTKTREIGGTRKLMQTTGGEQFLWMLPGLACVAGMMTLVGFVIFYCVGLPAMVADSWMWWLDSEPMRFWITVPCLAGVWGLGTFAYKRLILETRAPEKVKG